MRDSTQVHPKFFTEALLMQLTKIMESSSHRKLEFDLSLKNTCPEIIFDAREYILKTIGIDYNYSIIKRYDSTHKSGAYDWHIDPPQYGSEFLFICTLRGEADLHLRSAEGDSKKIECKPNIAILLAPLMEHRVTPPRIGFTFRDIIFFGKK